MPKNSTTVSEQPLVDVLKDQSLVKNQPLIRERAKVKGQPKGEDLPNDGLSKDGSQPRPRAGKAVTLEMVAKSVGITKTAASYALLGKKEVSEVTRARVLKAARELGYTPNPHAQRLSSGLCRGMVGLYSVFLDLGVGTLFVSELHHLLQNHGFEAPIYTYGHHRRSPGDYRALLSSVCHQRPEGLICNGFYLPDDAGEILEEYRDRGGTVICVYRELQTACDQVLFDRASNTYLAAKVLLEAGHRDIGLCTYQAGDLTGDRTVGFARALAEYDIEPNTAWLFEAEEQEKGGIRLAGEYLGLEKRPTALCIVNDTLAATFVHQVWRAGVRVPDDVSVVSMDGLPAAEAGIVPLTTVTHPFRPMAATTVEWMLSRLRKEYEGEPRRVYYAGEVIHRESVRKLT